MRVLIVEENLPRGHIWRRFLERSGADDVMVTDQAGGIDAISQFSFDVLVINVSVSSVSVLAVSDIATIRNPDIAIIAVTSGRFFSDGSIFGLMPNACGCVSDGVAPADLAAMIQHYGSKSHPSHGARPN